MSGTQDPRRQAWPSECDHKVRSRDNNSGFAGAETVCVACGQSFDPGREQQLRERDRALGLRSPHVRSGEGYIVG